MSAKVEAGNRLARWAIHMIRLCSQHGDEVEMGAFVAGDVPFATLKATQKEVDTFVEVAARGKVEEAERILQLPQNPDKVESSGIFTPLLEASRLGHVEMVRLLLEAGANKNLGLVNGTPLAVAARQGHQEVVRVLLKAGAWVDEASAGFPPLFLAAAANQAPIVRQLLKARADKDMKTANGNALGAASSLGHTEVVRALIEAGAVTPKGLTDSNMLFIVAFKGHLDVMRLLMENRIERDRPVSKRDHLAMATTLFANGNRLFAMWIIMPACTLSSVSDDGSGTLWKKILLAGAVVLSIVALLMLGGPDVQKEIRGKWAAFFEWKYLCLCYIRHYIMKY
ncbi:ANKRD50 [Symbiodinium natans]|uniref:ANKRD50 protein n=1 Tax=Symbiodinium natans TaxID=878477 RepID=A0A812HCB5_9DINO|nr:ANKRD50 [Symbiodinium natans]